MDISNRIDTTLSTYNLNSSATRARTKCSNKGLRSMEKLSDIAGSIRSFNTSFSWINISSHLNAFVRDGMPFNGSSSIFMYWFITHSLPFLLNQCSRATEMDNMDSSILERLRFFRKERVII